MFLVLLGFSSCPSLFAEVGFGIFKELLPFIFTFGTTCCGISAFLAAGLLGFPGVRLFSVFTGSAFILAVGRCGCISSFAALVTAFIPFSASSAFRGRFFSGNLYRNLLVIVDDKGAPLQLVGEGQDFMACIIGAIMCGLGLGVVFNNNGSTGGTDIIAAIVNKYKDVTLGRMIMFCDIIIISSCYFIFNDWRRVIFGFVTLFIIGFVLDYVVNSARQSVQFFIFSKDYAKIADRITKETHRGVTVLDGLGWYSQNNVKVLVVLAYKRQSLDIFRLVKDIDPNAFISQSSVIGVYGEGFDRLKIK